MRSSSREPRRRLWGALHHHVATDLVVVVAQAVRMPLRRRVEKQPWRLDRVAADGDGVRPLESLNAVGDERDAGHAADASSSSTCVAMQPARISQPCSIASGKCVINGEAFAFTLQPSRQKPR